MQRNNFAHAEGRQLFTEVRDAIKREPLQFQMEQFLEHRTGGITREVCNRKIPNCGTAACIAGWAYTLKLAKCINDRVVTPAVAAAFYDSRIDLPEDVDLANATFENIYEWLGRPLGDAASHCLFFDNRWPGAFKDEYNRITREVVDPNESAVLHAAVAVTLMDRLLDGTIWWGSYVWKGNLEYDPSVVSV